MNILNSDQLASTLMPGQGPGLQVVLFWQQEDKDSAEALESFRRMNWPNECQVSVLDVSNAPLTTSWFGIQSTPALGIVSDGALLAVEHQCSEIVCDRLLSIAHSQVRDLAARG